MKSNKKKIFLAALAICLVAILSFSTLAWFTAQDSVTNEFYVGDSTTDPDDVFGVDVWETVDGTEIGRGTADDEGAKYEDILPGQVLSKTPYLTNTGIHPQYVRAIVTVSEASILKEAMNGEWGDADMFLPGTGDAWTLADVLYTTDDELVYIYYYDTALAADATTEALFDAVVIPTGLTLAQAQDMESFQVSVLGQVIQSEYLMVDTAKDAFEKYWDAEGTIAGYTENDIVDNVKIVVSTDDELKTSLTRNAANIKVVLANDLTYDVKDDPSFTNMGGEKTKTITIDGDGNTITFNCLSDNNNAIITNNDAKLVINNANITVAGDIHQDRTWNSHDVIFACDVELNDVTSDKAIALKADATLKNVEIIDDVEINMYAIWIQANGQNVTIDGLTVDVNRGIAINDQYVTAEKVTLSVSNATFTTSEKAAITVNSAAGADITLNNVNIDNVADDTTNAVWVDGDMANVTVNGGTVIAA